MPRGRRRETSALRAVRGPAAVPGDVDAAGAQARVAEERLDAPAVGELDRGTLPARRLELRETGEVVGRDLPELCRDREAVVVGDQGRPAAVHLEQSVCGRRRDLLEEACAVEVRVPGLAPHERPVDEERRHSSQYLPSSTRRASEMPKWCAISWTTTCRTCARNCSG